MKVAQQTGEFIDLTDVSMSTLATGDSGVRVALQAAYGNVLRQLQFGAEASAFSS